MPDVASRVGVILDVAATVALAASAFLLMVIFAYLFTLPSGTVGAHPNFLTVSTKAVLFLGLLFIPTIGCAIAWPIHIRKKRQGQPVFAWLRFVVLASAVWSWFVFSALNGL